MGKSSLLNQLLGQERAIVSPTPGTTRDTIEETANVRGVPVVFIDTAGLREAADDIEAEGVRRSRQALAAAELILHVLDGSEPLGAFDRQLLTEYAGRKRLLVRNKADLPRRLMMPALGGHLGLELAALDLRLAANAVGEIVGKTTTEDLLDSIFSQFCIGK